MNAKELFYKDFEIDVADISSQNWSKCKRYGGYEKRPRPYSGFLLVMGDVEMQYILSDKKSITIHKNDLLYLPEGTNYIMVSSAAESDTPIYDVLFNFNLRLPSGENARLSDEPLVLAHNGGRFSDYFMALYAAFHTPHCSPLCVKAEAYRLVRHILSFCSGNSDSRYPIRAGLEYLEKNWNVNTPVSYLAELCGMSESYFRRLCNRYSGMSPVEYRNSIRISSAKSMLVENVSPISEIARAVGFDDSFYFSRLFRRVTGVSPSAYARSQKMP